MEVYTITERTNQPTEIKSYIRYRDSSLKRKATWLVHSRRACVNIVALMQGLYGMLLHNFVPNICLAWNRAKALVSNTVRLFLQNIVYIQFQFSQSLKETDTLFKISANRRNYYCWHIAEFLLTFRKEPFPCIPVTCKCVRCISNSVYFQLIMRKN
jgi:hypothetical protein